MASRSRLVWLVPALGVLVAALALGAWLHFRPTESAPVPLPVTAAAPVPPTPPPDPPLPARADSDAQLRGLLASLSPSHVWRRWLTKDDLLNRLVAAVDVVAQGKVPRSPLDFLAPRRTFAVIHHRGRVLIDPRSYHRFDAFADVIGSLDAGACAHAYEAVRPLLRVGYHAFGYPDRDFDDVVHAALTRVEAAPMLESEPALVSAPGALYRFADPKIESADDVQKQLLRMGPKNMLRVQSKARELEALLYPRRG